MEKKLVNGIYEQIINKELSNIEKTDIIIDERDIDKEKSPKILSKYFSRVLENGLKELENKKYGVQEQLEFCNELIRKVEEETEDRKFQDQIISNEAKMLYSVKSKNQSDYQRPLYSISEPNVFTGGESEVQLLYELNNEIPSADQVDLIVSFIKWTGIIRLYNSLKAFTERGGKLRIITTTYMGATDPKAINLLSQLPNTEIKISYDVLQSRLHVKSYIFKRNSKFSTAYVGSSNISRAALTTGTEWNVKITENEVKDVYDKLCSTFESYWNDESYETYTPDQLDKLVAALSREKRYVENGQYVSLNDLDESYDIEIKPYYYQQRVLDSLEAARKRGKHKNLVVAATGTGKTVMSAFDFKNYKEKNKDKKVKFLFVAHREEILKQSLNCFRKILGDRNFGQLTVGKNKADDNSQLFISIQSFNSMHLDQILEKDYYDYIIVDEFHHAAAESYQKLLDYFEPKELVGLTATPERMDGKDIVNMYFDGQTAASIRLPEAINKKLLVPFSYFCVADDIDLRDVKWERGHYNIKDLEQKLNVENRISLVIGSIKKYINDINTVKGLGFCVSKQHARYMAEGFNQNNIPSACLDSDSSDEDRKSVQAKLVKGEIKFIFVVDLYNEGVDIPEVNTVLFLRPTESLTVFLQQLGRGLRLSKDKDVLTVLDFVGLANKEYNFENQYRGLLSTNASSFEVEMLNGFPNVPAGCYIQFEEKAKEEILKNIRNSYNNKKNFISKFEIFKENNTDMGYENFFKFCNISPLKLYRCKITYTKLLKKTKSTNEDKISGLLAKIVRIDSALWIRRLLELLETAKNGQLSNLTEIDRRCLIMLYYSYESDKLSRCKYSSLIDFVNRLVNSDYYDEIISALNYAYSNVDIVKHPLTFDGKCPLEVFASYTRNQIIAALGIINEEFIFPLNAGVFYNADTKTDIFFVTLVKDEAAAVKKHDYSDQFLTNDTFHWQSQNTTTPESNTGKRYINHERMGTNVLLCVRDEKEDEFGNTNNYIVIGYMTYVDSKGSRPMSINWKLNEKLPAKYDCLVNKH